MLLNKETKQKAIKLLREVEKAKWDPVFIKTLTTLLDEKKSEEDLQREISALRELQEDVSSIESAQGFYILGFLHQYGLGVSLDKKCAAEYLELAAKRGIAEAQVEFSSYLLAMNDEDACRNEYIKKDFERGIEYLRAAEKQEHPGAKFLLGNCYLVGQGVKQDLKLAIEYMTSAAKQENMDAQFFLSCLYGPEELDIKIEVEGGLTVEKDLKLAIEYMKLAAAQGQIDAQFLLGIYYRDGIGVEKDLKQAMEWFRRAAEQGEDNAQVELGRCYKDGEGVEKDLKQAVEWFRWAAEQGNDLARLELAKYYEAEKDFKRAMEYFELAALRDDIAKCHLGMYYQYGRQRYAGQAGIGKDLKRAAEYYRQVVEQGIGWGKSLLAECYKEGHGVPKNTIRANLLSKIQGSEPNESLVQIPNYLEDLDKDFSYHQGKLEKEVKNEAERAVIYGTIGFCHQLGFQTPKSLTKAALFYTDAINKGASDALWDLFSCYREMLASDKEMGREKLEQFYKDLETPYIADSAMEGERLLLLAYLCENGGPYFEQNLFSALTHYQAHNQWAQGREGTQGYSQEKVRSYTPLLALRQGIKDADAVPSSLSTFESILTEYSYEMREREERVLAKTLLYQA